MTENRKTPKLRFKGFTDAWEQRKLSEVLSSYTDPVEIPRTGYERLGIRSHAKGTFHNFVPAGHELQTAQMHRVATDKFIVNITFGWEHAVAVTDENDAGKLVSHRFPQFSLSEELDPKFLNFIILDEDFRHHIWLASPGGAGRNRVLNINEMLQYEIMIPNVPEQRKIARMLIDLDNLITLHQRKLDRLKNIKKSMLDKMFPKDGEVVPEIRFKGFTDAWEQRKFSDLVEIGSGMDYKHLGIGDIPVYGTGGYMLSVDVALSENNDAIGIGRKGTIDKPYILRAPFWTVDTLFYCIPRDNHNLDFTNCLFQNIDWRNKDESTGVPSLSKVIINNIETSIPSYEEQKKIGEYFKSFENLITLHQRKLDKLKNIKKSMLDNMFV